MYLSKYSSLKKKFEKKEATIGVVGLGYVGLPLAVMFAEAGFKVYGVDISVQIIESLNKGASHVGDVKDQKLLDLMEGNNVNRICFTSDYSALKSCDGIVICVPTPLSKTGNPDMRYVRDAGENISSNMSAGTLIILESTVYPGATQEMFLPLIEERLEDHLVIGENVFLAFSPERIDPGRSDWNLRTTPKVIGGITSRCTDLAVELYGATLNTVVPVSSTGTAEMVKLLENTFRATNIALANELAIMCDLLNIDVWEVIDAASTKPFGFMPFYPGPGIGGHCIPIDPQYLSWKMKQLDYDARFISLAEEINSSMPSFVLEKSQKALVAIGKTLSSSKIIVLGVTYKPDIADIRESPALDVIKLLIEEGAEVVYNDPYVQKLELEEGHQLQSLGITAGNLAQIDVAVIVSDHSSYDFEYISTCVGLIVDSRNATQGLSLSCEVVKI
tara:strand:+ start:150 stop:1487 length:1338 start_codon:yes stop_codon:yes gene_type:complete